jgi:o-succinylbenzoate synthase
VTAVHRRAFALDLSTPLSTARGRIRRRTGVLIGVDANGVLGVGEATPLAGWTESLAATRTALDAAAAALGDGPLDGDGPVRVTESTAGLADAAAPDALTDALADAPAARHGVESALLDRAARRRGRSLAALLADRPADSVPVNATLGDADRSETVAAAVDAVDAGFACLKVKVGVGPLDRDLDRLRAVRAAVGADVTLRADANGAWDRQTAARAIAACTEASIDLATLEQPLPAADLSGHAALRGRGVDVALDETLARTSPAAVLEADAADVLVVKPMALGGPGRVHDVALRARAAGVDPVVTTTIDAAPARTAAVHVAAAIPDVRACGLATADALASDLVADPAPVADGAVAVPEGPGVAGAAFDDLVG